MSDAPLDHSTAESAPTRSTTALAHICFSDGMLLRHIRDIDFDDVMSRALEDAILRRSDVDFVASFRDFAAYEKENYPSAAFEVYDVTADAKAAKVNLAGDGQDQDTPELVFGGLGELSDAASVWDVIKEVNISGTSVGRITIVQEPTPLMLVALQLAMSPHFDTLELLHHLVSDMPNKGYTRALMRRAFEQDSVSLPYPSSFQASSGPGDGSIPRQAPSFSHTRKRSFLFVFKYFTVIGEGCEPAAWHRFDPKGYKNRTAGSIDICEGSSILALSLGGEPTQALRMRSRQSPTKQGFLFDTFGPWHVLSIQSFSDDQHTVRGEAFQRRDFYNGPHAFLQLLIAEYEDAHKRNQRLNHLITKLIVPPREFIFDHHLRDKLLFGDEYFSYLRRYFWAYNTLAVVNTSIKAMMSAYSDAFDDTFWEGSHVLQWPHPSPASSEGQAYLDEIRWLRSRLEKAVSELDVVLNLNERTRKDIENLRDQLVSGSSSRDSKRASDLGANIQVLTMVSMIFQPLTFITSVWGMTEFKLSTSGWRFATTMAVTSISFMTFVVLLQSRLFNGLGRRLPKVSVWFLYLLQVLLSSPRMIVEATVVEMRRVRGAFTRRAKGVGEAELGQSVN